MPTLTTATATAEAQALAAGAEQLLAAYNKVKELIAHNSDLAHDWDAGSVPSYITEDGVGGNMNGLNYTRFDISNIVSTLDEFRKLMENQTPNTGDHLGNLNNVSRPAMTRVRVDNQG
jgi:hypothetical protein